MICNHNELVAKLKAEADLVWIGAPVSWAWRKLNPMINPVASNNPVRMSLNVFMVPFP